MKAKTDLKTKHCAKRDRHTRYHWPSPYVPYYVMVWPSSGSNRHQRRRAAAIKRRKAKA
jgi:hypothetical protein